jgi:hypothetical protein
MPVTPVENEKYRKFVSDLATKLGVFDFKPTDIVWHYTNGDGFLGILQSSALYATQVAALNDAKETEYATDRFKQAINQLIGEKKGDPDAVTFLNAVLEFVKDERENPVRGTSKFFVTCFSAEGDDINQWSRYSKGNAYAIGFHANGLWREPTSCLYRVNYDKAQHEATAKAVAEATLNFYMEGLTGERVKDPDAWAREFFEAWDEWVYKLAPLAKDHKWAGENEYRIVHELKLAEFPLVRFTQKKTMLARYLPLAFPCWVKRRTGLLPIAKIRIGPNNHPAFTSVSARLLLDQMGYPTDVPIEVTTCTLTDP